MAHTVIVAFEVNEDTQAQAQDTLMEALMPTLESRGGPCESWWIAQDDRRDGSDNDSAVFVPYSPRYTENLPPRTLRVGDRVTYLRNPEVLVVTETEGSYLNATSGRHYWLVTARPEGQRYGGVCADERDFIVVERGDL